MSLNLNNMFIQFADQVVACQDEKKIKQFDTRTKHLSGFLNFAFTTGYASYLDSTIQAQFLVIKNAFTAGTTPTCKNLGYAVGYIVSEVLDAKTESSVPNFSDLSKFSN